MHLVVGLGNPGEQYRVTRHNIGFAVVTRLWQDSPHPRSFEMESLGLLTRIRIGDHDVLLLKPQTFMNRSGRSVSDTASKHGIAIEDILVVHDDLDHPLGVVRIKRGGGSGGHRGLESCFEELGTTDLVRVRVGIGRPGPGSAPSDYVLDRFDEAELGLIDGVVGLAADAVVETLRLGADRAMNHFNRRPISGDAP